MRILSFTICFFCAVCMFSQTDSSKRKPRISNTTSQNDVKKTEPTTSTSNLYSPTGYNNGHGYVDLGLSVKWATCNIGAKNPGDWGNYYAWGEVRTKSAYTWSTLTHNGNISGLSGLSPEGNAPSLGTNKEVYRR